MDKHAYSYIYSKTCPHLIKFFFTPNSMCVYVLEWMYPYIIYKIRMPAYIYIYIYMYIYTHIHTYTRAHTRINAHTCHQNEAHTRQNHAYGLIETLPCTWIRWKMHIKIHVLVYMYTWTRSSIRDSLICMCTKSRACACYNVHVYVITTMHSNLAQSPCMH